MSSENKLKIKTLPSETDPDIIIPVVSPQAVQGTFPEILKKDETNVSLDEFLIDLKSYLDGLGTIISNMINSKFSEKFPASEETGVSWEETIQNQCNDLSSKIDWVEKTMWPVGMIIKSYDFEHYPDGSDIDWENGKFNLSDIPSGWELMQTQEELVYLISLTKVPVANNSYKLFTIEEAQQYFLSKYKDINFTTSYTFIDNQVQFEATDFRVYGSVANGDAAPGNQAHIETLQQIGNDIYVTWDKENDNGHDFRFNIELKTVRPCFVWRRRKVS